jgi:hypothetical protein
MKNDSNKIMRSEERSMDYIYEHLQKAMGGAATPYGLGKASSVSNIVTSSETAEMPMLMTGSLISLDLLSPTKKTASVHTEPLMKPRAVVASVIDKIEDGDITNLAGIKFEILRLSGCDEGDNQRFAYELEEILTGAFEDAKNAAASENKRLTTAEVAAALRDGITFLETIVDRHTRNLV